MADSGPIKAAQYRGVYCSVNRQSFVAQATLQGHNHYLGTFKSAAKAAEAFDHFLRHNCAADKLRLKKSLNFPSAEEAAYQETREQARDRGLKLNGNNHQKEAQAFKILDAAFAESFRASEHEIRRLSGSSKADAVFMRKGSPEDCLLIQLKAASGRGIHGRSHMFSNMLGYAGMVVFLVSLDGGYLGATAGHVLSKDKLWITVGCPSAERLQVRDVGSFLLTCFVDRQQFPHTSLEDASLQCACYKHKIEAKGHAQLQALFGTMGMRLTHPTVHQTTVDSLLEYVSDFDGSLSILRVQEKISSTTRYPRAYLFKSGGVFGRCSYAEDDFDILVVGIMCEDQLHGAFLIPMPVLVEHGLAGDRGTSVASMALFPSWCLPKRNASILKYSWQLDFFVDLRDRQGSNYDLAPGIRRQIQNLLRQATHAVSVKCWLMNGVLARSSQSMRIRSSWPIKTKRRPVGKPKSNLKGDIQS